MRFFSTFAGAFYSASLYRRLRYDESGYGLRYSILLLLWIFFCVAVGVSLRMLVQENGDILGDRMIGWLELMVMGVPAMGVILAVALPIRFIMLFALAVAARLMALRLTPTMEYDAALRLAAVAYTPAAVADAMHYVVSGHLLNPFVLFASGVVMLLAALKATR